MARPTINEVARVAGVSKSTVSRVLNDAGAYVSPETRAKVLQVIEQLNYRPNSLARSLSLQRTHTIGLLTIAVGLRMFASEAYRLSGVGNATYHLLMAGSIVAITSCVLLFLVAQRYFVQGVVTSGLKGV